MSGTRGPLPLDSLQFTYLDADGNPVALNDFPGPFRTGMDLTEGPNGFFDGVAEFNRDRAQRSELGSRRYESLCSTNSKFW